MNDTKWNELRLAMYALGPRAPRFRVRDACTATVSAWDSEWYYHLRAGGFDRIEWVDISVASAAQRDEVLARLREIHLPGETIPDGFRIYGFTRPGHVVDYIR